MPTVLSAIIEQARINLDLTQGDLGARVDRGQQAVQKWESGETKPPPKVLKDVAQVLGLPSETLMYEADYLEPPDDHYWSDDLNISQRLDDGLTVEIRLERRNFDPDASSPVEDASRTRRPRSRRQANADLEALREATERVLELQAQMVEVRTSLQAQQAQLEELARRSWTPEGLGPEGVAQLTQLLSEMMTPAELATVAEAIRNATEPPSTGDGSSRPRGGSKSDGRRAPRPGRQEAG